MNDELDPNLIQVEIFGRVYKVRGDEDQGYIEELARYVDSKMQTIAETTGTIDSLKVAILAALNIADELFKIQNEHESSGERITTRANELADALDKALNEDGIEESEEARDTLS